MMRTPFQQSAAVLTLPARHPVLVAGALLCLALVLWIATVQLANRTDAGPSESTQILFENATGIRVVRVALTAANGLADLQYQVLDPDKALIVHDREQPPTLVHQQSRAILNRPFHGHGFHTLKAGVTYRLQLWNSGGVLQRGDRVTVQMGDAHLDSVLVE